MMNLIVVQELHTYMMIIYSFLKYYKCLLIIIGKSIIINDYHSIVIFSFSLEQRSR